MEHLEHFAHASEEATGAEPLQHAEAVRKAPDTRLAISEGARRILRADADRDR
jgi:hypothetical protein